MTDQPDNDIERNKKMSEERKKHVFKRTGSGLLRAYIEQHKLSIREAADNLGVTDSGIRGWLAKDDMPLSVEIAITALNRLERRETDEIACYLVLVRKQSVTSLLAFCKAMGITTQVIGFP
ncbi:MAG: hypothetical protein C5B59_17430 [Bacteroidetes bacterium]|nr:MAG: hypothetical protein C5B59_17430 [Bacteroidota bacterium]